MATEAKVSASTQASTSEREGSTQRREIDGIGSERADRRLGSEMHSQHFSHLTIRLFSSLFTVKVSEKT